ncbi:MAG: hypothetical protein Q9168_002632 [Polycauliona sp. 1 TL-2023]
MAIVAATSLVGLQIVITTLTLGFVDSRSTLRLGGLLLVVYLAFLQTPHIATVHNPIARGFLANSPFVLTILCIDKTLLSRWTFIAQGPTSSVGGLQPIDHGQNRAKSLDKHQSQKLADDSASRLRFGFHFSLQSRFVGTGWPVKNIPAFDGARPGWIPTKAEFLQTAIPKWIFYVLVLDLAGNFNSSGDDSTTFSSERVPLFSRLARVHMDEITARLASTLGFWIFQYIVIEVVYGAIAITAILSGLSAVKAWPPMFGSIRESYSLRQFWGCFYHQLVRRGCGSIAHAATYRLLQLQRGGFLGRYLFILLTFAVSGAFHTCSDVSQGIRLGQSGAIRFFCMQTLGILIEDGMQASWQSPPGEPGTRRPSLLIRMMGYMWVVLWLVWTTPSWTYPMMKIDQGGRILPFSVLTNIRWSR